MSKRTDLRVLKTQKLIRDSFLSLIDKKGFAIITINDIAEKAQINRSTFYLHYTDKYALLDKMVDEAMEKLVALVAPEAHIQSKNLDVESLRQNIQAILTIIAEDVIFYKIIFGENRMFNLREKMADILKQKFGQSFREQTLIPDELFLEMVTSLYMGAIAWWLSRGTAYSPSYMAQQLVKIVTMGPAKVCGLIDTEG
ncbi:MAG TPA: TetR/AcrR family transcriptional regulator [Firmicutes bacterium]|jgi:AcrR family transcriptional regulator|nr:TetR/AcrR family transcriptional regulator [Bacillota bacterium]